jgi:hypothetical protein
MADLSNLRQRITEVADKSAGMIAGELAQCEDYPAMQQRLDQLGWPHGPARPGEPTTQAIERRLGQAALVRVTKAQHDAVVRAA